jgi:hypothetical protein
MVRPRIADGGDGLHIWMVAANISNMQSRTADKLWYFSLGFGRGANKSLRAKKLDVRFGYEPSGSIKGGGGMFHV